MSRILHNLIYGLLHPGGVYLFVRLILLGYAVSAVGRLLPVRRRQVANYQARPARDIALGVVAIAAVVAIGGYGYLAAPAATARAARKKLPPVVLPSERKPAPLSVVGVFEPDDEASYQQVSAFGRQPNVVLEYAGWNQPFPAWLARDAYDHGAELLLQVEPTQASMAAIAAGQYDSYLRSYADQVRAFGHPVILSFAPEANGSWYSWGWTHTPPSVWIAAWRHVVTVMRQQGADKVTWLWTVNVSYYQSAPLRAHWPGSRYVDWIGIDGYFEHRKATFASVFGKTLAQIRRITTTPVLLSETAAGQVSGQATAIPSLFAGIASHHLLGLVWFDQAQHQGIHHQDWRLEDNPAGEAAFRQALAASRR